MAAQVCADHARLRLSSYRDPPEGLGVLEWEVLSIHSPAFSHSLFNLRTPDEARDLALCWARASIWTSIPLDTSTTVFFESAPQNRRWLTLCGSSPSLM